MSDIISCKWTSFAHGHDPNGGTNESKWLPGCQDIHGRYSAWPSFGPERFFYTLKAVPEPWMRLHRFFFGWVFYDSDWFSGFCSVARHRQYVEVTFKTASFTDVHNIPTPQNTSDSKRCKSSAPLLQEVHGILADNYYPDDTFPRDEKCDLWDQLGMYMPWVHEDVTHSEKTLVV